LIAITDATDATQNVGYDYDNNGNQTIKTKNGFTTTFVYDVRDQLISVRQDFTTLGLFKYDYQGLRIYKDMGGQIVRYTYDDDSVLMESDNTGATIAKFDYGMDRLLSLTHAIEGRQFYLFDALGSVSNLTNTAGSIQARYQYDAFGGIRGQAGSSFNRFTFTGHEADTETGLYYFKARFYDPDTGASFLKIHIWARPAHRRACIAICMRMRIRRCMWTSMAMNL
jgi:YD repeat-containing protein